MKLRDLFVRIGFDVDDKPIKELDAGIKGLIVSIGSIVGAVAGAAASLFALAKTTANVGEEALHISQMLGLGVQAFQELQYAADIAGISQGEFEMSIRQLANSAEDAARGVGQYAQAYSKLGINVTSGGQMKQTDQILMELAEHFSRMPDSLEKTALANDIFGRAGMRLIPFLNRGTSGIAALRAEAESLGVVLSEADAKASEEFNISLKRLWGAITGLKNQIGVGLMPAIIGVVTDMQAWIMANRELIRSTLQEWIKRTVALLKSAYSFAKSAVNEIKALAESFGGLNKVLRLVTTAFAVFIGLKLLYSIGLIAQGVYGLVTAFWALSAAEMAATAAAAALPLLIGGAVIALIAIFYDLYRFVSGEKSFIGVLIAAFEQRFPRAFKIVSSVLGYLKNGVLGVWEVIKGFALAFAGLAHFDLGAIKEGLSRVWRVFADSFAGIGRMIKNSFMSAFDFISETTPFKMISGVLGKAWDFMQWGYSLTNSSPTSSPVSSTTNISNSSPSLSVSSPITINMPAGIAPEEIGPRVQIGVQEAFNQILRQSYFPNPEVW